MHSAEQSPLAYIADDLFAIFRLLRANGARAGTLPDLTLPQFKTFMVIARLSPAKVSDVANALGVDRSVASRAITHLVKTKFIVAVEGDDDRRYKLLAVSDQGRALLDQLWDAQQSAFDELAAGFDEQDAQALAPLLHKLFLHMHRNAQ